MGVGGVIDSAIMAQESVLGSMLIDAQCIGEVMPHIRAGDFTYTVDQEIFKALRSLFMDCETIDPVIVLHKAGNQAGMSKRILDLMDVTPTAAHIAEYVKIMRDEAKRVKICELGQRLAEAKLLDDAQSIIAKLNDLMVNNSAMRSVTMGEAIINFYDRIKTPAIYHTWGFPFLDAGLYAEPGDLIILGGRPSDGKTALALSMAYHQAKTQRVGFFSLETKEDKLFDRLFSHVASVKSSHIKRRTLTESDHETLAGKAEEIKDRDLHLIRAAGSSVGDISAYARARKFDVIYIDYLQLISSTGQNRTEQVTNISLGLHTLSQQKEITVVALAQLSRDGDSGKNGGKKVVRPPRLSDLRESGQIEQDADAVIFIYREEADMPNSRRILSVAKNKEGTIGNFPMLFNGETQTFRQSEELATASVAGQYSAIGRKVKAENRQAAKEAAQMEIDEKELPF